MNIRPSAAIRQNYNEIAELCRKTQTPVYLTKNGEGDLVIMDIESFTRREKMLQLRENLLAVDRKVLPADVKAGQKQIGAAGGLSQVDYLPYIALAHVFADKEKTALGEAAAAFVHTYRRHVCSCLHCAWGQVFTEIKVSAVSLVSQHQHAVVVGKLGYRPYIAANAVVGGVID